MMAIIASILNLGWRVDPNDDVLTLAYILLRAGFNPIGSVEQAIQQLLLRTFSRFEQMQFTIDIAHLIDHGHELATGTEVR